MNKLYNLLKRIIERLNACVKSVNGSAPDANGNVEVQSGVQSDWSQNDSSALDYVKNRPGGYVTTIDPITITWDGSTDGKIKIDVTDGVYFYYVSSEVVSKDQFVGGSYTITDGSSNDEWEITDIVEIADGIFCDPDGTVLIATTTGAGSMFGYQLTISQPGVYFIKVDGSTGFRASSFTAVSVTRITPIPMEYVENSENILLSTKPISTDLVFSSGNGICSDGDSPAKFEITSNRASIKNNQSSDLWFTVGFGDDSNSNVRMHMSKLNEYIEVFVPNIASGEGEGHIQLKGSYVSGLGYGSVGVSGVSSINIGGSILTYDQTTGDLGVVGSGGDVQVLATKAYVDNLIGGIENGTY